MSLMGWLINHTFYLTHMALTINHRRDGKGKREADRCAESMRRSCLQAWLLTSTKMKEGSLSDMQGIPIQLAFSKDTSLSGHVWARFDSSRCSHATQKHESRKCEPQIQSVSADGYQPNCFGGLQWHNLWLEHEAQRNNNKCSEENAKRIRPINQTVSHFYIYVTKAK